MGMKRNGTTMDIKTKMVNRIKRILVYVMMLSIIPIAAFADDSLITGAWYTFFDRVDDAGQTYSEMNIFFFKQDGEIYSSRYDIAPSGETSAKDYKFIGYWLEKDGAYKCNIAMQGLTDMVMENETLAIPINDYYWRCYKLQETNIETDVWPIQ